MEIHVTARKFRARKEVRDDAIASVKKLGKYYDGILRTDVILSYERSSQSVKVVEINLHVHGAVLAAKERSEEFAKSIDLALGKIERQLEKYKTKIHLKNRKTLRKVKEGAAEEVSGENE
ncbi:MAG TPA: ribosome-associated translation inhibitor RaiA [Bacteroidota bacterium]|jgi:putative sigma-54 modulation protein|nr:ribosome-associated translation inhibitor RaiA [Bacteroidota bacterium]